MDIDKYKSAAIWASVKEILEEEKPNPFKTRMEAILHTEEEEYDLFRMVALDQVRDYTNAMMDDTQLKAYVPLGDYVFLVYAHRENLEITITTTYLKSLGDREDKDKEIVKIRYKAILDPDSPRLEASDYSNVSQKALNLADMLTVKFRLMDRNVEPLRVKTTQGVFRGITPKKLITNLLLGESQKVTVDGKPSVEGLDLVDPDRTETNVQVTIPSGTFVCEIPTYIQERANGVYKNGIGTYYQRYNKKPEKKKPLWFVYPLYDHERFEGSKGKEVAIFYAVPPKMATRAEKTYKVESGMIEIAIATDKITTNTTNVTQLNHGIGYRLTDSDAYMKKPVKVKDSGEAEGMRANLNREVGFMERKDGLNYVPVIRDITTNPYNEISKVATRQTGILKFIWENAEADYLYPGMPCKYCYMQDNELTEVKGTLVGVHASTVLQSSIAEHPRFTTHCVVLVATDAQVKPPEFDKKVGYRVKDDEEQT